MWQILFRRITIIYIESEWSTQLREAITEFQGVSPEDDDLY